MKNKPKMKLAIYRDATGQWRWQMKVGKNILAVSSESYKVHRSVVTALKSIIKHLDFSTVNIIDTESRKPVTAATLFP